MSYSALLTGTVTYWAPGTPDGFGGMSYAAPVQISARYQDESQNYQDRDGEEFISKAVAYVAQDLAHNGWIYNGTSAQANPQNQAGAYRIRTLMKSATPSGSVIHRKVVLG